MDKTDLAIGLQETYIDLLSAGKSVNQIWDGMAAYVRGLPWELLG